MAIIKLGSLVLGIRGTVGGVVYSAGLGGPYARAWGRSSNPRAVLQQRSRAHLGGLPGAWQSVSASERSDWDVFAATDPEPTFNSLGEPVTLSGYNYFVRCNVRRLQVGLDVLLLAPTGIQASQPPVVQLISWVVDVSGGGSAVLTYVGEFLPYAFFVPVMVTVLPTEGAVYNPARLRWIGFGPALEGSVDLWPLLHSGFGDIRAGWTVVGRAWRQKESGLRSVALEISTVAV